MVVSKVLSFITNSIFRSADSSSGRNIQSESLEDSKENQTHNIDDEERNNQSMSYEEKMQKIRNEIPSDGISEPSEDSNEDQIPNVHSEKRNDQSSNNEENDRSVDEMSGRYVDDIKSGFAEGRYSIEGSKFESEEHAIKAYQNLMSDFKDREKVMNILDRYGIKDTSGKVDASSRKLGYVDYDRDEPVRKNR